MPFGLAPVGLLLQIIAMEVGVHASDLREAVGGDGVLEDDVVAATATVLAAFLPSLAGNGSTPDGPVRFRLQGEDVDLALAFDGTAWAIGDPADGATIWGVSRVALPASVAPGATVSLTFTPRAPAAPGSYTLSYRMVQELVEWFGATTSRAVNAQ